MTYYIYAAWNLIYDICYMLSDTRYLISYLYIHTFIHSVYVWATGPGPAVQALHNSQTTLTLVPKMTFLSERSENPG